MRDKVNLLKDCINSIHLKKAGVPYEIIIVDNNSKDEETLAS